MSTTDTDGDTRRDTGGPRTKVFVSYSRRDRTFVTKLVDALEREDDIEVFRDTEDILPTEEWKERLEQLIGEADTIVFALSPHSARSEVCHWEIDFAESLNKRIAPIVIRDVKPENIPKALTRYNYIFFTRRDDFAKALANLTLALNTDIDWIREHTRLGDMARRWDAQRKLGAQPLRGRELAATEDWLARQPENAPSPTAIHRAYIAHSRRATTRRQQYWLGGSVAAAVVTSVLAGFAFLQKQEAERNLAQALSAADTLVIEIAQGMKDFQGVPIARIRSVLEKAEAILKRLEASGGTNAIKLRQAVMLDKFSDAYMILGDLDKASERAGRSSKIMTALVESDPKNTAWQRDLATSYVKTGDIQRAKGDLTTALAIYRAGLAINEGLTKADPNDPNWRRDLSISHDRVGDVLVAQGKLPEALASYKALLKIGERLAEVDAGNADWQRGLGVAYNKVGDVQVALRDLPGALGSYNSALAIRERWARAEPKNVRWQRDLSASYGRLGHVLKGQGNAKLALKRFNEALAITERLAASDPGNTLWQRDLSVSHNSTGDILFNQGNYPAAHKHFNAALAIRKRLTHADPTNAAWRRDLGSSHQRVGEVLVEQADLRGARDQFEASLAIRKMLGKADPGNARGQSEISDAHSRLAVVYRKIGDRARALSALRAGHAVLSTLLKQFPDSADLKEQLAWFAGQLREVEGP